MAATGQPPTLEWATGVQPLLVPSFSTFNRNDLPNIVKGVVKSEVALLTAEKEYEPFCSSFVGLASHYLGGTAPSLPKTHLNGVLAASRVLLRYLLNSLDAQNANGAATSCTLTQSQILQLIRCLCRGMIGLHKADVVALGATLKAYDVHPPPFCAVAADESSTKDRENANPLKSDSTSGGSTQPSKRPRLGDSTMNLFEQLTSVFHDVMAAGGAGAAAQSPLRSIYASLVDNSSTETSSTPSPPAPTSAPTVAPGAFWMTSGGALSNQPPPPFVGHLVADPQEEMRMLFASRNIAALKVH